MTIVDTPPGVPPARDLRRLWRVAVALTLPVGPLLIAVSRGILPYWSTDSGEIIVARSLADLPAMETIAWLGLLMMPCLLLSTLALGYVARRGAPVLATVGAGLSFVAYANWGAAGGADYLVLALGREGVGEATVLQVVEATLAHPIAFIAGFGWVLGHIVGTMLLGAALWRSRVVAPWVAAVVIASQPVHLVAAVIIPSVTLDVLAGWGLTAFGYAMVSVAVLRTPDAEWDLPPVRSPRATGRARRGSAIPSHA